MPVDYLALMDVSAYLERIQYKGETAPALSTLQGLQYAHALSVPFENLDIHRGVAIELDLDRIYKKVIYQGRGGFCYELNGLFHELLMELGFSVTRLSARVFNVDKEVFGPPFDHLTNRVRLEGLDYLTDVGFGDFPLKPLPMVLDEEIDDITGRWVFTELSEQEWLLSKYTTEGTWLAKYCVELNPQPYAAFQGMCTYQQQHPDSHFRKKKMITQAKPDGRITLSANQLKKTLFSGEVVVIPVQDTAHFEALLKQYFGIELSFPDPLV